MRDPHRPSKTRPPQRLNVHFGTSAWHALSHLEPETFERLRHELGELVQTAARETTRVHCAQLAGLDVAYAVDAARQLLEVVEIRRPA